MREVKDFFYIEIQLTKSNLLKKFLLLEFYVLTFKNEISIPTRNRWP